MKNGLRKPFTDRSQWVNRIHIGDATDVLRRMPEGLVHCVVTSPPYWHQRRYDTPDTTFDDGWRGQLGLEPSPELYVRHLTGIFKEVKRVLRRDGTLWLNLGDSYSGGGPHKEEHKNPGKNLSGLKGVAPKSFEQTGLQPKNLVGIPWRVAFALRDDGWLLRSDCIWHKPNPMPGPWTDRPVVAHEYVFLFSKSARYYYDWVATRTDWTGPRARETAHNLRSVWTVPTQGYKDAHFAVFPERMVRLMIEAGTSARGCCPKCGSPWKRVVHRTGKTSREWQADRGTGRKGHDPLTRRQGKSIAGGRPPDPKVEATGWEPACSCKSRLEDTVPCVVMDPFVGSGTTAKVAVLTGRDWVGVELGRKYGEMAERKVRGAEWIKKEMREHAPGGRPNR